MRGVMRFRRKFFVFISICLVFIFYNTLIKFFYLHDLKATISPLVFESHLQKNNVSSDMFEKCGNLNSRQCLQFLRIQSRLDVELQVEREGAVIANASQVSKTALADQSYLIPSENFVIELGTTPVSFFDVPKVSPKTVNLTKLLNRTKVDYKAMFRVKPVLKPLSPDRRQQRAAHFNNSAMNEFLSRQTERKEEENKYCTKQLLNNKEKQLSQGAFKNIIIDKETYLTFCPIYKAASTSWLINILKLKGLWNDEKENARVQHLVNQFLQKVTNLGAPWISKGTTRFIVVRHPLHRLISCYRDKYEKASKSYYYNLYGEKMVRLYRSRPKATKEEIRLMLNEVRKALSSHAPVTMPQNPYANPIGPTFEEFVRYIVHARVEDDHWRPYYLQCAMCHMTYDFVLKFENIKEDSKQFIEYLNFTKVINTGWKNPTAGGRTTDEVVCSYLGQIDSNLLKELLIKYEHDFKLFQYNPETFYKCVKDYK